MNLKTNLRKFRVTRKEFPRKKRFPRNKSSLLFRMKGIRLFRIKECEKDLIKYKNNEHLDKCREELGGALNRCEAEIKEVEKIYEVEAAKAKDKIVKLNTEVVKATEEASKCKKKLIRVKRKL